MEYVQRTMSMISTGVLFAEMEMVDMVLGLETMLLIPQVRLTVISLTLSYYLLFYLVLLQLQHLLSFVLIKQKAIMMVLQFIIKIKVHLLGLPLI